MHSSTKSHLQTYKQLHQRTLMLAGSSDIEYIQAGNMEKDEEVVILVVGTDTESKTRVADALARAHDATEVKTAVRGVRKFTRKSSREFVIVDTVPFSQYYIGMQIFQEARRWISQHSLRRIFGKQVCIVCVVTGADDALDFEESISEEPTFKFHLYSWLHFLGFIFPEHKGSIEFVAVNGEDTRNDDEALAERFRMSDFIQRHDFATENIAYADLRDTDLVVGFNIFRLENSKEIRNYVTSPFLFKEMPSTASNVGLLRPWVPERLILFGRTGSGKSTLAQMLTLGRLDPNSDFPASDGIRGKTTRIHHGEGRGWHVVDTPGFGEIKGGSITSEEALRKVKKYVQMIDGSYTHYIYVVKKDRIDKLEETLWAFFVSLFGECIKDHFTLIVTGADKKWMTQNIDHLKQSFNGCESFLCAEFPPIPENDEEWEMECREIREESLKELEDGLSSLQRFDTWCDLGEWSRMTAMDVVSEATFEILHMTDAIERALNALRIRAYKVSTGLRRLYMLMSPEDECQLLPLVSLEN